MNPPYQLTDTAFLRSASFAATRWQISGVNGGLVGAKVQVLVTNTGGVTTSFKFQTAPQPLDSSVTEAPALDNLLELAIPSSGADPSAVVSTETLGGFNSTFVTVDTFLNTVANTAGVITMTPGARMLVSFKAGAFVQLVPVTPTSIPTSVGPGILRLEASCNLPITCVSHDHQRTAISLR